MDRKGGYTNDQIPPQGPPFSLRCSPSTTQKRFILCKSLRGNRIAARDLVRSQLWNASRRRHGGDSYGSDSSCTVDGESGDNLGGGVAVEVEGEGEGKVRRSGRAVL